MEAMGHGLPVIAPGHLALNELIGDDSGLLFPPRNMLYGDDGLELAEFAGVDDDGVFRRHRSPSELQGSTYACGLYQLIAAS